MKVSHARPIHAVALVIAVLPWMTFVFIALPGLLLTSAAFFALTTFTRSMMATYLAVVAFFVLLGRPEWRDDSDTSGPQVMQEIVDGNGWVLPLRNGRHIPVKPLLFNWLGALSALARQSGVDRVDARLPSALLATLCAVFAYFFTRRLAGGAVGLWAAMILITTPQFVIEARNSRVDMTFCAFLTMGLLLAHRVWESERGRGTAVLAVLDRDGRMFRLGIARGGGPMTSTSSISTQFSRGCGYSISTVCRL